MTSWTRRDVWGGRAKRRGVGWVKMWVRCFALKIKQNNWWIYRDTEQDKGQSRCRCGNTLCCFVTGQSWATVAVLLVALWETMSRSWPEDQILHCKKTTFLFFGSRSVFPKFPIDQSQWLCRMGVTSVSYNNNNDNYWQAHCVCQH